MQNIIDIYHTLYIIPNIDKMNKIEVDKYYKNQLQILNNKKNMVKEIKNVNNDIELFNQILDIINKNKKQPLFNSYYKNRKKNIINYIHEANKYRIIYKREVSKMKIIDFKVCLINSDFSIGFNIKRNILYEILNKNKIEASFEPDIYPGVNSKFYWNIRNKDTSNFGICTCYKHKNCEGRGDSATGNGIGKCKKVTISIFQSGKIIITGAKNLEQIKDSYKFINYIIDTNYDKLKRKIFNLKKTDDVLNNKYNKYIYINNIKNIEVYKQLLSLSSKELSELS